jgi:hypothetical protein
LGLQRWPAAPKWIVALAQRSHVVANVAAEQDLFLSLLQSLFQRRLGVILLLKALRLLLRLGLRGRLLLLLLLRAHWCSRLLVQQLWGDLCCRHDGWPLCAVCPGGCSLPPAPQF